MPSMLACGYHCTAYSFLLSLPSLQIFVSFFKTLVGKEIAVELKNDVVMTGTLHSVDQYLNVKLLNVKVINPEKYPQLVALKNCFVRGSVVRYIQIPPEHVDTELLQDAARRENAPAK
jgi:small nuclear ribonucleoprotein (snRNP)-like protein